MFRYFYSAGALRIHKLRHHWEGSKKHKCPHCTESFLLPVELRRHLVKKHGDASGELDLHFIYNSVIVCKLLFYFVIVGSTSDMEEASAKENQRTQVMDHIRQIQIQV